MSEPILFYGQKSDFGEFSNFFPATIWLDGKEWPSTEHYYMAQKTADPEEQEAIRQAPSPGKAKRMGREVELVPDWDEIKFEIMHRAVYAKFDQNEHLRDTLLRTGDRPIHENCRDPWWGGGPNFPNGRDWLGKVLMQVRAELREKHGEPEDRSADMKSLVADLAPPPASDIVRFYEGSGTDARGRTFEEVLAFNDDRMERVHDYIQWLFPLPEASRAQPKSPVASEADLQAFRERDDLREQVRLAYRRWMAFLQETNAWRGPLDHNHLRITRVIRFLTLIDLPDLANDLYTYAEAEANVSAQTLWYWSNARDKDPVWLRERWRPGA